MRWNRRGRSENLEDRRARRPRRRMARGAPLGLGGILLLLALSFVFEQDFFALLGSVGGVDTGAPAGEGPPPAPADLAAEEEMVQFVSFVLDDNQETWTRVFASQGNRYPAARLVLFRDAVESACGFAGAASGPFYCPGDQRVYLDLGFFDELRRRFGAPGDFAQAYVIAHEIGHHVQNVLGIEPRVRRQQQRRPSDANQLSVAMELQADCFAGIWGHSTAQRSILEGGDIEEGLDAAAAIGDDRIQRMAGRSINPEAFTHGSSEQRVSWFRRGLETGDPQACDTFGGG